MGLSDLYLKFRNLLVDFLYAMVIIFHFLFKHLVPILQQRSSALHVYQARCH